MATGAKGLDQPLSVSLDLNLVTLNEILGNAQDLSVREFAVGSARGFRAAAIRVEGLADRELVNEQVLGALMHDPRFRDFASRQDLFAAIKDYGVQASTVKEGATFKDLVDGLLVGDSVLLLDGVDQALTITSKGWEDRHIAEPITEGVVRGPRDGFTETLRTNTALLHRRIKSPALRLEGLKIGRHTRTEVVLVYLDGVAPKALVDEVKSRLQRIEIDSVLESGYLEEFIEDSPWSPFPQIEHSERPDKVAAAILEGRVAILTDTTPFVLVVPTVFVQFLQSSEDYYERFYFGSFLRGIRALALFISVMLPAVYIALTSFHQEMIPTPLALSIAASREGVPFPAIGEALLMEATFEIPREAGIRLPRPTGQAVSIVGALVIGQAAVQAGIVSQAMMIIVALTGISSFALPAFNAAIASRLLRFPLMLLAAVLGMFGILTGLSVILIHLYSLRSFGVNYLMPITSGTPGDLKDVAIRAPWWTLLRQPRSIARTKARRVQPGLKPGPQQPQSGKKQ